MSNTKNPRRPRKEPDTRIEGASEVKNFSITPRIVTFGIGDPYHLAVWNFYRDAAGENGACYVSTWYVATVTRMSEEKVSEVRQDLINRHFLKGEKIKTKEGHEVWYITIPDLWSWNADWCRQHPDMDSRAEFCEMDTKAQNKGFERICRRCHRPFMAHSNASFRDETCQVLRNQEKQTIKNELRKVDGQYKSEKIYIAERDEAFCPKCGRTDNLELHLVTNNETQTYQMEIICEDCHDRIHAEDYRAFEVVEAIDIEQDPHLNDIGEDRSNANDVREDRSSPERSSSASFNPLNDVGGGSINNNINNNSRRTIEGSAAIAELWAETRYRLRHCGLDAGAVRDNTLNVKPVSVEDGILHLFFGNQKEYIWATERKASFDEAICGVLKDIRGIEFHLNEKEEHA